MPVKHRGLLYALISVAFLAAAWRRPQTLALITGLWFGLMALGEAYRAWRV
jgi:hypothetical protein